MFTVKNVLVALSILSLATHSASARPTGLRRRCQAVAPSHAAAVAVPASPTPTDASTSSPSGAANVAPKPKPKPTASTSSAPKSSGCFPSLSFNPPKLGDGQAPSTSLDNWWCARSSEYAFLGFSYDVTACPSKSDMTNDFNKMSSQYQARYVRIYSACDREGFYDDVVEAAYNGGLGVYALVWFGFNGGNIWQTRMNAILSTIKNNPLAPYVVRNFVLGSEAMFDNDLPADELASNIKSIKSQVSKFGIQVTTSDMPSKFAENPSVVKVIDHFESNSLPFFAGDATTGANAWGSVQSDLSTFAKLDSNKPIVITQTGWPSNQDVWKANSGSAVASVSSEAEYYDLLDSKCSTFKKVSSGSVGWFAHIWDDNTLSGWGVTNGGKAKFAFNPRTSC